MKKFKLFFNIVDEEQWLNEQLEKGYLCTNISGLGIYTFKRKKHSPYYTVGLSGLFISR